ncbi:class I adenylate-forming enzyme family protein [Rhodococcus sp. NPDC056960]|uniref:class I adenylate-forming enzyme family protein n=1 Tax=Rhodococcus sp. NPDC056960 TaxID=3345982 RepID=UPI00363EE923
MTRSRYSNFGYTVLSAQRDRAPHRLALSYGSTRQLTYAELDSRVNRTANALLSAGVQPGERVATLLDSTLSVAENYLAQTKLGSVLCALNPYWDAATFEKIVTSIEATAFVYDVKFDELADRLRPRLPQVTRWIRAGAQRDGSEVLDLDELTAEASDAEPPLGAGGDDPLALFFTSGTTGLPKAVQYTHASGIAIAQGLWADVPALQDAALGTGPIIWGVGFIAVAAPALAAGIRLVLEDDFGPVQFLETVPREGITHISVTPSFFAELLANSDHSAANLDSLRVALLGGEPLLSSLQERIAQRLPNLSLYGYYGQTEAPYSVIGRRDDGSVPDGVVGRARFGGAVRVVDSTGVPVLDTVGEIQISGPHVTAGYFSQPEATAEALRDGWFVGGDVGSIDAQGLLTVLGRRADSIERGGVLTLPAQIEDAASRVEGVAEAGAIGLPVPNAEPQILLVLSPERGCELDSGVVADRLAVALPAPSRPDHIVIVDSLPHANDGSGGKGKLLRRVLVEQFGHLAASSTERG